MWWIMFVIGAALVSVLAVNPIFLLVVLGLWALARPVEKKIVEESKQEERTFGVGSCLIVLCWVLVGLLVLGSGGVLVMGG